MRFATQKSSGTSLAFPDVCKVPAPPAPFVPIPYPNSQFEANLKQANETDAKVKAGSKAAKKKQAQAIKNAKDRAGIVVSSATQAVMVGRVIHLRYLRRRP